MPLGNAFGFHRLPGLAVRGGGQSVPEPAIASLHSRIVFYGDGTGSEAAAPGDCNGPLGCLSMLAGRVRGAVGWNQCRSGDFLDDTYGRRAYTIDQKPDICVIWSMGHNDELLGANYATGIVKWKRNVQAIVDGLPDAIIIVSNTLASTVAGETNAATCWAEQLSFVEGLGLNVYHWDAAAAFDAGASAGDGTHPDEADGVALATSLYAVLDPLIADATFDDILNDQSANATAGYGANVYGSTEYNLEGTGGTKSGTVAPTGDYANVKRITNNLTNGSSVAVTCSKDASPDPYEKQVVVISGTPASRATIVMDDTGNQTLTGGGPGDFFEWLFELQIDDGAGAAPVGLRSWAALLGALGGLGNSGDLSNFKADRATPINTVIRCPPKPIFGTATPSANPALTTRWSATALDGRIIISRVIVRKVETVAYAAPKDMSGDSIVTANETFRVTGTASSGSTLRCDPGKCSGGAITHTYQWKRYLAADNSFVENISGATNPTLVLGAGDVGYKIGCTRTATNSFGAISGDTALTAAVT